MTFSGVLSDSYTGGLLKILVALLVAAFTADAHGSQCTASSVGAKYKTAVESCVPQKISRKEMKEKVGADMDLNYVALTVADRKHAEAELFTDHSELIIGIDVTGNTKGHTYLILNDQRVDGRMFYAPHTEADAVISRGLILRYKNIPPANRARLEQWLKGGEVIKTPTCVVAASIILFERAGFKGPESILGHEWFPSPFLEYLAKNGLVGEDGRRIPAEVYTINQDIRSFWDNLPNLVKVPSFFFQVLADPYTWQGAKK